MALLKYFAFFYLFFFLLKVNKFAIDWEQILKRDPLKCAQSLICQIVAGAENNNQEAIIINELVRYVYEWKVFTLNGKYQLKP